VLEVSREVVSSKERREEVNVVSVLEDLREKLDSIGNFGKGENNGDAEACFRIELDHVECT
jgi:hypothetical protein